MKIYKYVLLILIILFSISSIASAANLYVRASAIGSGNGSDWTNAYTSLPATLTRGDTYYIADGDYGSYTVDDAVSGTSVITIKKATASAHGTETGWDNSYGDGQAVFAQPFNIRTSYIIFDGVVGSGSDPNAYGFKIDTPSNCNQDNKMLGVPPVGYSSLVISNITVSHVAMTNCGSSYDYAQVGIYSSLASASNITISYNYFKNNPSNMLIINWSNSTISNNYFAGNWSSASNHGQQISPGVCNDIILSNNIFKDNVAYVLGVHYANNNRWKIYNNIVINGTLTAGFASADSGTLDVVKKFEVHNNTFINVQFGGRGAVFVGNLSDQTNDKSYAYNNLFYNCSNPRFDNSGFTANAITYSHNAHFNSTGTYNNSEGGTAQVGTGDPFVDSVNNDYRLKASTDPGKVLDPIYSIDIKGYTRGLDSNNWDRGAIEFKKPTSPQQLTIQ